MAIQVGDNFQYKGKKFLDDRMSFDSLSDMKAYDETSLPDGIITYNKEDSKYYKFLSTNSDNDTTGKWREHVVASSGSGSGTTLTKDQINAINAIDLSGDGSKVFKDNGTYDAIKWDDISNAPFNFIDGTTIVKDTNNNLSVPSTFLDGVNTQINGLTTALSRAATIDDTATTTSNAWSASKISQELADKASSNTNHNHSNLDTVLNKLDVNSSNKLVFDSKTIMDTNTYDTNGNGKVDAADKADNITGLLATIAELNYLQGVRSNIQNQIDALTNGVNFKGEYATFAAMQAAITSPKHGDWVYIVADETKNNQGNTQYVHDGSNWIYGGGRTTVNDATDSVKGIIQLAGDLAGNAAAPELKNIITAQSATYIKAISVDAKGRVTSITEDDTLTQRIADLEARPQIIVSPTQPTDFKDGDIWIEG